ncbi:NHL repeat-containing protein [Geothermobacter ehrlichii]|uniref:NHL repeat-containing protein n=1 Tax=Geothermobacter ehrlichii TaxID=213224 RepID=A0A5D3WKK3_9BACT|nr:SMP-30/gluconolactonase/LRE family protein [Geothermobacter ehrlichii]TYO98731.1 NHL repeat-containing protein [Geothermobacter ehrlichii]
MHRALLLLLILFLPAGCVSGPGSFEWASPVADLVWPKPPDLPRIRYLRSVSGTPDAVPAGEDKVFLRWLTGEEERAVPLVSPYGVVADGQGRIWVADPLAHRVAFFDLARKKMTSLSQFGQVRLDSPLGLAFDPKRKRLYISDPGLRAVVVVDPAGRLLGLWTDDLLQRPAGMAVDAEGRLYLADVLLGEVLVFSPEGTRLERIGSFLTEDGKFNRPANVAVDRDGTLFVVDSLNFRVEVISAARESLGSIGELGDIPGRFARPRGIALDSDGHVYVADAAFGNIQIFDRQGRLLLFWGEPGQKPGQFSLPAGLYFDGRDRLYVVDAYNHRLQVFQYVRQREVPKE